jgi:hypothetical protein
MVGWILSIFVTQKFIHPKSMPEHSAPKFGAPQLGPETQSDDFLKNAYNFK